MDDLLKLAAGSLVRVARWPAPYQSSASLTHDVEPRRFAYTRGMDRLLEAIETTGHPATLGLVAWKEQNLLMAEGPVRDFGFLRPWDQQLTEAMQWQAGDPAKRPIFILEDAMGRCIDKAKATSVGYANRRQWWLVPHEAVIAGCAPDSGVDAEQEKQDAPDP